jgi:hypothetical protein
MIDFLEISCGSWRWMYWVGVVYGSIGRMEEASGSVALVFIFYFRAILSLGSFGT